MIGLLSSLALLGMTSADRIEVMRARDADWRIGPIVYHAFVDRFAPSANLEAKKALYGAPRELVDWSTPPKRGVYSDNVGVWTHELAFWGGDLQSLRSKLDHVQNLADVLYVNPIHEALTNHKYDATNYDKVDPAYGTEADFAGLVEDLHGRKMRLVLDGVFNHCGRSNPIFSEALGNLQSSRRDWFLFDSKYPSGYRAWANVGNLPEINLENPATRDYMWQADDSIVAQWLKRGADGWRLDVAHEIGLEYLADITEAAHKHKPNSLVIGEVWNYPSRWTASMDGLLNVFLGRFILEITKGNLTPRAANASLNQLVEDCGIEPLMRSWIVLGNHDTARLATNIQDSKKRRFAQALQFTLPGAPLIYYGDEIAMTGGDDPLQRAPMQWDKVSRTNKDLTWTKSLTGVRRKTRALRIGDFRALEAEQLVAFLRTTEKALEATIVVANPSDKPVAESFVVPDGTLMGYTLMKDELSETELRVEAGILRPTVPPHTVMILTIHPEAKDRGQYKRMKDGD